MVVESVVVVLLFVVSRKNRGRSKYIFCDHNNTKSDFRQQAKQHSTKVPLFLVLVLGRHMIRKDKQERGVISILTSHTTHHPIHSSSPIIGKQETNSHDGYDDADVKYEKVANTFETTIGVFHISSTSTVLVMEDNQTVTSVSILSCTFTCR